MINFSKIFSAGCLIIGLFLAPLHGQNKSVREQRGLTGTVRIVRTKSAAYSFKNGKPKAAGRRLSFIEEFDEPGNLLRSISFASHKKLLYREKHIFTGGRLTGKFFKNGKFSQLPDREILKYDGAGNLIEETGYDAKGQPVYRSDYVYNDKNQNIQWTSSSSRPNGRLESHRFTYSYDEQGRLTEEKAFSDDGGGFVPADSLGRPHRKTLVYEDADQPGIELYYDARGDFAKMTALSYDGRGNETEKIVYDEKREVKDKSRSEYKYDRYGNWTEMKTYRWQTRDGKSFYEPAEIYYRSIKYF